MRAGMLWMLVVSSFPVGAAPPATTAPAQQARLDKLREQSLNAGAFPTTRTALAELRSMGQPANDTLREVLKTLLDRDAASVEQALADTHDSQGLREADQTLSRLQSEALANLAKLANDETLTKAHEYYEKLVPAQAKLNAALKARETLLAVTARRPQLTDLYRQRLTREEAKAFSTYEAELRDQVQKALVVLPAGVSATGPVDPSKPPQRNDPDYRIWLYRASRQIEAYNELIGPKFVIAEEMEAVRALNQYREALGLLALEIDPRLILIARLHSKVLVEIKDGTQPPGTAPESPHRSRAVRAGYVDERGAESAYFANPPVGGRDAFMAWFDAPGFHKELVSPAYVAIAYGRWHGHWTTELGSAARLSLAPEPERVRLFAKIKLPSDDLAPAP